MLKHLQFTESILIYSSADDDGLGKLAKSQGVECVALDVGHNYGLYSTVKSLTQALKNHSITVIHTHGYKSDMLGLIAAKMAGIKTVATPHGWDLNQGVKIRFFEFLNRCALPFFDAVAPLSKPLADTLTWTPKSKISIIPNFIDTSNLPEPEAGDPKLISYIGRLTELKRVSDIITALTYCSENVRLQIIGDGPKKAELVSLIEKLNLSDRVTMMGYREDRLELLNNSSILVLASTSEGTSRSAMEAMALGKLVIASDIPGNRILIDHGETGLLFPVSDAHALARCIDSAPFRTGIRERGRRLIHKSFSANYAVSHYEVLYFDLFAADQVRPEY
ncbi:MAG: glycosyltransferase [Gammaproteobacteria bacterium]|nr:glycosyltransferase [Gammaproteobacteria bacterium]